MLPYNAILSRYRLYSNKGFNVVQNIEDWCEW